MFDKVQAHIFIHIINMFYLNTSWVTYNIFSRHFGKIRRSMTTYNDFE